MSWDIHCQNISFSYLFSEWFDNELELKEQGSILSNSNFIIIVLTHLGKNWLQAQNTYFKHSLQI